MINNDFYGEKYLLFSCFVCCVHALYETGEWIYLTFRWTLFHHRLNFTR